MQNLACAASAAVMALGLAGCAGKIGVNAMPSNSEPQIKQPVPEKSETERINQLETEFQDIELENPETEFQAPELQNIELQIRQSYLEHLGWEDLTLGDVSICKFYGEYNGSYVVMMTTSKSMYTQALWSENVAGVKIQYTDGNRILVWVGGEFYNLAEAYANGYLVKADIQNVAGIQNPSWTVQDSTV